MSAVVSLNAGSSSIKFAVFTLDRDHVPTLSGGGKIERIGMAPILTIRSVDGTVIEQKTWKDGQALTHAELLSWLFDWARIHLDGRCPPSAPMRQIEGSV